MPTSGFLYGGVPDTQLYGQRSLADSVYDQTLEAEILREQVRRALETGQSPSPQVERQVTTLTRAYGREGALQEVQRLQGQYQERLGRPGEEALATSEQERQRTQQAEYEGRQRAEADFRLQTRRDEATAVKVAPQGVQLGPLGPMRMLVERQPMVARLAQGIPPAVDRFQEFRKGLIGQRKATEESVYGLPVYGPVAKGTEEFVGGLPAGAKEFAAGPASLLLIPKTVATSASTLGKTAEFYLTDTQTARERVVPEAAKGIGNVLGEAQAFAAEKPLEAGLRGAGLAAGFFVSGRVLGAGARAASQRAGVKGTFTTTAVTRETLPGVQVGLSRTTGRVKGLFGSATVLQESELTAVSGPRGLQEAVSAGTIRTTTQGLLGSRTIREPFIASTSTRPVTPVVYEPYSFKPTMRYAVVSEPAAIPRNIPTGQRLVETIRGGRLNIRVMPVTASSQGLTVGRVPFAGTSVSRTLKDVSSPLFQSEYALARRTPSQVYLEQTYRGEGLTRFVAKTRTGPSQSVERIRVFQRQGPAPQFVDAGPFDTVTFDARGGALLQRGITRRQAAAAPATVASESALAAGGRALTRQAQRGGQQTGMFTATVPRTRTGQVQVQMPRTQTRSLPSTVQSVQAATRQEQRQAPRFIQDYAQRTGQVSRVTPSFSFRMDTETIQTPRLTQRTFTTDLTGQRLQPAERTTQAPVQGVTPAFRFPQITLQPPAERTTQRTITPTIPRPLTVTGFPAGGPWVDLPRDVEPRKGKKRKFKLRGFGLERAPLADLLSKTQTEIVTLQPASSPSVRTSERFFRQSAGQFVPTAEMLRGTASRARKSKKRRR